MDPYELTLTQFPLQARCERSDQWQHDLFRALRDALGIDAKYEPQASSGYGKRSSPPWEGVEGELTGGLRVLGTKKRAAGEGVVVDYALFAPDGTVLAWAGSLMPRPMPAAELLFGVPGQPPIALDAALKAKVKAMAKAAKG